MIFSSFLAFQSYLTVNDDNDGIYDYDDNCTYHDNNGTQYDNNTLCTIWKAILSLTHPLAGPEMFTHNHYDYDHCDDYDYCDGEDSES